MNLKDKYLINNATWLKLKGYYIKGILLGFPFLSISFAFMAWAINDNIAWGKAVLFSGAIFYASSLLFWRFIFVRSKYTLLFANWGALTFIEICFIILSSACAFRFFGTIGVFVQSAFLLIAGVFLCRHYYIFFNKVWDSHKRHNETIVLDLKNGRYDFLNNFDMNEAKVKKTINQRLSNPAIMNIVAFISPVIVGSSLMLRGKPDIRIIIPWVLSIPFILGWLKVLVAVFYNFRKISYYEKKIGKPIINGLLD